MQDFSVIVCSWRRPSALRRCLETLRDQTRPPSEILVVGVEGDVETLQVLEGSAPSHYALRVIWQPGPLGLCNARNLGWRSANCPWVAYVDDDATTDRHWIENLGKHTEGKAVALGGHVRDPSTDRVVVDGTYEFHLGVNHRCPAGCNMAFRRDWLVTVGGFDEFLTYGYDDHDIGVKLTLSGAHIENVSDALVWHERSWGPTASGRGPNFRRYATSGAYVVAKYSASLRVSPIALLASLGRLFAELAAVRRQVRPNTNGFLRDLGAAIVASMRITSGLVMGTVKGLRASRQVPEYQC